MHVFVWEYIGQPLLRNRLIDVYGRDEVFIASTCIEVFRP